jgi:hypothetical protein
MADITTDNLLMSSSTVFQVDSESDHSTAAGSTTMDVDGYEYFCYSPATPDSLVTQGSPATQGSPGILDIIPLHRIHQVQEPTFVRHIEPSISSLLAHDFVLFDSHDESDYSITLFEKIGDPAEHSEAETQHSMDPAPVSTITANNQHMHSGPQQHTAPTNTLQHTTTATTIHSTGGSLPLKKRKRERDALERSLSPHINNTASDTNTSNSRLPLKKRKIGRAAWEQGLFAVDKDETATNPREIVAHLGTTVTHLGDTVTHNARTVAPNSSTETQLPLRKPKNGRASMQRRLSPLHVEQVASRVPAARDNPYIQSRTQHRPALKSNLINAAAVEMDRTRTPVRRPLAEIDINRINAITYLSPTVSQNRPPNRQRMHSHNANDENTFGDIRRSPINATNTAL